MRTPGKFAGKMAEEGLMEGDTGGAKENVVVRLLFLAEWAFHWYIYVHVG